MAVTWEPMAGGRRPQPLDFQQNGCREPFIPSDDGLERAQSISTSPKGAVAPETGDSGERQRRAWDGGDDVARSTKLDQENAQLIAPTRRRSATEVKAHKGARSWSIWGFADPTMNERLTATRLFEVQASARTTTMEMEAKSRGDSQRKFLISLRPADHLIPPSPCSELMHKL